jgi:hypothetical protein
MHIPRHKIPAEIWDAAVKDKSHCTYVGNIELKNGGIRRKYYFDYTGEILGEEVGLHDGISAAKIDFADSDIIGISCLRKVNFRSFSPRDSGFYMFQRKIYGTIRKWHRRIFRKRGKRD